MKHVVSHLNSQLSMLALDPPVDHATATAKSPAKKTTKSVDVALRKLKERTDEIAKKKKSDIENRVLQESFPLWDDEMRGVPNPFIRSGLFGVGNSKEREFLDNLQVTSLSNYNIRYSGRELHQTDLSVWMSLISMARSTPLSDKIRFSGYQILRDLGWRMHSESYKRVQESIDRLKVTGITIETKNQSDGYVGSLIREYAWADADEKGDTKWMVRFEPKVAMLFMNDTTTFLEWEMRKKIGPRAMLAQFLHAFYASHRDPIPLTLQKLHEISRSGASLSTFRRNINTALQMLVDVGMLSTFDTSKDVVRVIKRSSLHLLGDKGMAPKRLPISKK